jgi:hypothetical protein
MSREKTLDTAQRPHTIENEKADAPIFLTRYEKICYTYLSVMFSGLILSEGYPDWAGGLISRKPAPHTKNSILRLYGFSQVCVGRSV